MNTRTADYIIAIAEEGNLSLAAKRLGVSQPTLSAFLSQLENELGVDMFIREKKHLIPTSAGKIYIKASRQILGVKEQTYQAILRLTHKPVETITIGATPLRGSIMVAQIFPKFNRRFPYIKVEIREAYTKELWRLAENNEVSYSLGSVYDSELPGLDTITISKEEVIVGVPAFHPLAPLAGSDSKNLVSLPIEAFADSPFVLLAPGTTVRKITDHIFSSVGIRPTVIFETNNNLVLSSMIRQGAGVGLLPRSAMIDSCPEVVYFSLKPRYYLNLAIVTAKGRKLTEAERYFAYLIIRQDTNNPLYIPDNNAYARSIVQEFGSQEVVD